MIDTLRLNLTDCEIKKSCPMTIQQGLIDYSSGKMHNNYDLFIDTSGKIVQGSKAYLNDDKFNLTIYPTFESETTEHNTQKLKVKNFKRIHTELQHDLWDYNYEGEDEVKGIFLSTSLPRLLSSNNFKTLSYDEQKTALNNLENRLKTLGIKTNIYNSKLSRVDTFTNISTEQNFYVYSDLFSLMECSRMKSVDWNGETFLWKNGHQELTIYDKVKEMQFKIPESKIRIDRNVMRFENRLLKKKKIESVFKFKTLGELYKNYNEVKSYHKKEITNKIFKYTFDDIKILTENTVENQLYYCKNQFGDKCLESFLKMEGMKAFMKSGNDDFIINMINKLFKDKSDIALRQRKSRILRVYREMKFHIGMFGKLNKKYKFRTNIDLYNELKTKFYKEVA